MAELGARGATIYSPGAIPGLVDDLIPYNPTPSPGKQAFSLGQGAWEVFSAPHIARLTG